MVLKGLIENGEIMRNFEAVIFDLDGTLVDSMWMWKSIDIEYLSGFNIELPDDLQESIEGKSFSETACYFKERFNLPVSIEQIKKTWNEMSYDIYKNRVELKKGVGEFLEYLKAHNIKMGIATSNSRELATCVLEEKGIIDYFGVIVTGCDVNAGKPNPDVYLKAAEVLNVKPEKCLVFEDVPQGIMAGKNADMTTCAVEDEYSAGLKDEKIRLADYYIKDYYEAERLFEKE